MPTAQTLREKFEQGLPYERYVATGTSDQQKSWAASHARVRVTPAQSALLSSFVRQINVVLTSGTWCGDCVHQVPMLDHISRANPACLHVRILDRDADPAFRDSIMICGGTRVPTVLFANEDFDLLALYGDKSLARLRALAAKALGASCPLPGATLAADEGASTLQDWVDVFERAHLTARLSTKLRQRHGD